MNKPASSLDPLSMDVVDGETPSGSLFRPSKRRKVQRKRVEAASDDDLPLPNADQLEALGTGMPLRASNDDHEQSSEDEQQEAGVSVADIIRQRKVRQRKRAGMEFTSSTDPTANPPPSLELALIGADDTPEVIKAMETRFAQQTGRITEQANVHMEAYIDREIEKRAKVNQAHPTTEHDVLVANGGSVSPTTALQARNPASQGKLHEIDLGPSARLLNQRRTVAAITGVPAEPPPPKKPPKPRMGRNGKMYIPRPRAERNRRNSADIARDKVVEELLRENKLDVYDDAGNDLSKPGRVEQSDGDHGAADDRLAEQFQKEYFDAQSQRKEKMNKMPGSSATAGKPGEEKAKGPKLGGSRNARAAMKEREEAAARAAAASKGIIAKIFTVRKGGINTTKF